MTERILPVNGVELCVETFGDPTDPATGRPRADYESSVGPSADGIAQARLNIVIENTGPFSGGRLAA